MKQILDKNISNYNSKNENHGYQEFYYVNNKLSLRGNFKNGSGVCYRFTIWSVRCVQVCV